MQAPLFLFSNPSRLGLSAITLLQLETESPHDFTGRFARTVIRLRAQVVFLWFVGLLSAKRRNGHWIVIRGVRVQVAFFWFAPRALLFGTRRTGQWRWWSVM